MAHVTGLDFEHEIIFTCDVVDLGDLGDFLDCFSESFDWLAFVESEGNVDEGDEFPSEAFGIKDGYVAFDDSGLLEDSNSLEDTWGTEPDGFCEVSVGDPSVRLKEVKNLHVRFVKLCLHEPV